MTDITTSSSRRERRRQAQPRLARAVANNAGSVGRGVAIVATASGLMASSAVAANAVPQDGQETPAQRTESGAIPGQDLNDYLPGTRGVIEQLAQQKGLGESLLFQQLVSDEAFVADNGELDHGAIADEVDSQGAEENSAPEQTLADYLPGTRGVVEQFAELKGQSPEALFETLISNPNYVAENGELDHQALVSRVAELSGQNESADQQAEQEQAPAQQEQAPQAPAEEDSSQQVSASLADYLPGTRGLVEELAQLEGTSASAQFQELINDSAYTDGGVLDHAALQSRVAELTGSNDDADRQQAETQSESDVEVQAEQDEVTVSADTTSAVASAGGDQEQSSSAGSLSGVVSAAYSGLGTPYVWGGKGPGGWDCSGFVSWAYSQAGYDIPSSTGAIQASDELRWTTNPQPGDLVVQNGGGHVAIYVGNGQFIGAQNPSTGTLLYSYDSRPGNSHVGYLTVR